MPPQTRSRRLIINWLNSITLIKILQLMLRISSPKLTSNTYFDNDSAYEVLSDDSKRRNYDQTGATDENQSYSQEDMFKNYYSASGFGSRGNKGQSMGGF